jgi:ATP-binding cassette subfamily B protein
VSSFRRLLPYLLRYRLRYLGGAACLLLATLMSISIPWTVKRAVDTLERDGAAAHLAPFVLLILALAAAHGLARLGSRFAILGAGQWVEHDLRTALYARLLTLPPAFYHAHRTGDLMSRASNDISTLRALAGFGGVMLIGTIFAFAGTLGAMSAIDPWLTLFAMAPFPGLVVIAKRFNHDVEARSTAVQEQLGALSAKAQENLTGMAVVRAYTMEEREIAEFARLNAEYRTRNLALARTQSVSWPLMGLVSGVGALIVLWLGGKAVVDGRISLGSFVAFNGYLAQLAWPTIALGWTLASIQRGLAAMQRVTEILDSRPHESSGGLSGADGLSADWGSAGAISGPPQMKKDGSDKPPSFLPGRAEAELRPGGPRAELLPNGPLEFRHLTFAYDDRGPALRDVSFVVPAGSVVAVVGPTGSGKSTLGTLLCRLYEPPRGTVWVGGRDVLDLPLGPLRRSVGYVPQESFLFSRPLRDNVRLADEHAGPERLEEVARTAGLADDLGALAAGWDTVVGERGLTLSGGQRQRVALARALVADPPFLVLDDVLASVDAAKEWEITRSLRAAASGRTTLLMTHRLKAAAEADRIVVLDEGRVVEQGRHPELLAAGGLYARLWRVQQLEDELANA